ncbi:MAG: insulinase family protein, partial [Polyangiaceae bacterium]|nr:insulinase family protein [Polyangiaceae bacterium]
RFFLQNGLQILLCAHHAAPVVAYHTWYRVGSRHERESKTGLAHLFEHLMFNETESYAAGEFDRKLEEAGAESNAATWLDWTQYTVSVPRERLPLVIELEAERMAHLVLRAPQVQSEKEVVANERRYRVEDDVEGSVSEQLWATAFERHSYRWPTIGWMDDILGFTEEDCRDFYRTYYAPNNATLVVVGDVNEAALLRRIAQAYGRIEPSILPVEEVWPEPPQFGERRQELSKPTPTEKLAIGYRGPAMGDADHPAVTVLSEILFGGRASRMQQRLVQELELATEARVFVGPFRDPGLVEVFVSARGQHTADELLAVIGQELERLRSEPVTDEELHRARARLELGLVAGLTNVEGKASTLGFYETVLGRPAGAFERLEAMRRVDASDVRRAARRYLVDTQRTVLLVRSNTAKGGSPDARGAA